tara:strand:- start:533 stop:1075 length:543 start_codon:yes stop_codon:yes gene_type:complete
MTILKSKKSKNRHNGAINPSGIQKAAEGITYSDAVNSLASILRKGYSPGRNTEHWCNEMLRQMNDKMSRSERATKRSLTPAEDHNKIRGFLLGPNGDGTITRDEEKISLPAKYVFSIDKNNHAYHNRYFAFRPKSENYAEAIYQMLGILKVLADNNDETYPNMVRFYRWIENEMKQRSRF